MSGNDDKSWWDDDPEWKELRQRIQAQKVTRDNGHIKESQPLAPVQPGVAKEHKNLKVSLNITLPKLPKLPKPPKFSPKQLHVSGLAGLVIVIGLAGLIFTWSNSSKTSRESSGVLGGAVQDPEFDTLLPGGKKEETASGKLGYDAAKKVASFKDTIGNVAITISQQPLPETFKSNPDEEVKKLAESFSANDVITESNPKAYLGTSIKGPQTVIFHKKGLLVFIQSAAALEKSEWAGYITKLL